MGDKVVDLGNEGLDVSERPAADSPLSDDVEPDFYLIEP